MIGCACQVDGTASPQRVRILQPGDKSSDAGKICDLKLGSGDPSCDFVPGLQSNQYKCKCDTRRGNAVNDPCKEKEK